MTRTRPEPKKERNGYSYFQLNSKLRRNERKSIIFVHNRKYIPTLSGADNDHGSDDDDDDDDKL